MQVDPLAVLDNSKSPFVYGANNPVFFNDPMGLQAMAEWLPGVSATAYHRYNNIYGRNEASFLNEWYETFESGSHSNVSRLFNGLAMRDPNGIGRPPRYDRSQPTPGMPDRKYDIEERTLIYVPIQQARDNFQLSLQVGGGAMSSVGVGDLSPKATRTPARTTQGGSSVWDDFWDGFLNPDRQSDPHISVSLSGAATGVGYVAEVGRLNSHLQASKYASTWAARAAELKAARAWSLTGKTLGVAGAVLPIAVGYLSGNNPTAGDWTKATINAALVFAGPIGWGVLALDIGWGLATGTTISDRIGAGVDRAIGN